MDNIEFMLTKFSNSQKYKQLNNVKFTKEDVTILVSFCKYK